jgi:hypothetical protein
LEDYIRMILQDLGCGVMDWINLARGRGRWRALVNAVMNFRVPYNARKLIKKGSAVWS